MILEIGVVKVAILGNRKFQGSGMDFSLQRRCRSPSTASLPNTPVTMTTQPNYLTEQDVGTSSQLVATNRMGRDVCNNLLVSRYVPRCLVYWSVLANVQ